MRRVLPRSRKIASRSVDIRALGLVVDTHWKNVQQFLAFPDRIIWFDSLLRDFFGWIDQDDDHPKPGQAGAFHISDRVITYISTRSRGYTDPASGFQVDFRSGFSIPDL